MRTLRHMLYIMTAFLLTVPRTVTAMEEVTLTELLAGWGTDLDSVEITAEELASGVYLLHGAGGAVLTSIGSDGVLLVDDQFAELAPRLDAAITDLGGNGIDFVINTHWHFDHADGNPWLGARGAKIIAHSNSRRQMLETTRVTYVSNYYDQPPYPASGLPVLSFDDAMTVHWNDETIDVRYFGPGHTTGDAAVFFRNANIVHVGDLYNARYPYIDAANGGSLAGLIAVCGAILEEIDRETRVVSGHAPITDRAGLSAYVDMLKESEKRLLRLIEAGNTLEEVLAARPTADYDAQRGNPTLFVTMAYQSIARSMAQ